MGAPRYGISLPLFNSVSHKWAQRTSEIQSWTHQREISYLQAAMCYFVYFMNILIKMSKVVQMPHNHFQKNFRRLLTNLNTVKKWYQTLHHRYHDSEVIILHMFNYGSPQSWKSL